MNLLNSLVADNTGLIHFVFSILAVVFGTIVLIANKGSVLHKQIGKLYGISMLILLATAFMIYRLYDTWGIFHWAALVSTITLLIGMVPMYIKRPSDYVGLHFSFMYWSVMGLYAAFVSESMVRIPRVVIDSGVPNHVFYIMTGVGTTLVMGFAGFFFARYRPQWEARFSKKSKRVTA